MTTTTSKGGGRAILRLLKALARAHAYAEIDEEDPDAPFVRVYGGGPAARDVVHRASFEVWRRAECAGLVEVSGQLGAGRWTISALGRAGLREGIDARLTESDAGAKADDMRGDRLETRSSPSLPQVAVGESPLAWLHRRRDRSGKRLISDAQLEAGERLRLDYEIGQLMQRVTVDWARAAAGGSRHVPGAQQGLELGERALAARQRVAGALSAVGPELASLLIDVCCHLKGLEQLERAAGWPQRSAKIVLQVALSSLARHYGVDRHEYEEARRAREPARVLHWGAAGYRPRAGAGDTDAT